MSDIVLGGCMTTLISVFFFFNDTATTEIYTLSLHDALPISNICVEAHLRELLEQGFEVVVAKDATAAPRHPEWGYGYTAALINFRFLAHAVLATDEVVTAMQPVAALSR